MTKKILALALAGTTAFSVFGSVLTASAAASTTDPEAYKSTAANSSFAAYAVISVTTAADDVTIGSTSLKGLTNNNALKEAVALLETDSGLTVEKGFVYLYDYAPDGNTDSANKTTLDGVMNKIMALPSKSDAWDAGSSGYATLAEAVDALADALAGYYQDGSPAAMTTESGFASTNTETRRSTYEKFVSYQNKAKDFDAADFDTETVEMYNAQALITDILGAGSTTATSLMKYYMQEYDRVIDGLLEAADTSTKEETYYRSLDRVQALEADDYTVYNWRTIETHLANAEDKAAEGKWDDAIEFLNKALAVTPEKATYTDLRDTLMSMYDNGGRTSASYILANYPTTGGSYAVYNGDDYKSGSSYTPAWKELFGATGTDYVIEYDLDRDGSTEDYNGVYAFAYEVYRQASRNIRVGQSTVDYANEMLTAAIEALAPTSGSSNWSMLKLETLVELASSLDESDFNTNARAYKTFVTALERAEAVLGKTSAAKGEVDKAISSLDTALKGIKSTVKAIPYATRKALTDAYKDAQKLYKDFISDKVSGAQVVALKEAIDAYENNSYKTCLDIEGASAHVVNLISDAEAMTAEFDAAINGFNQAQGWYTNAEGKWMYGEGDGYYVDGWKQIGNFWFFFNADGTAKQNEWFQDGSNWYYCGNSCVAYSGWGKVDGSWYYFSKANVMCTGWIRPSNSYYYLNPTSGKMVTGWAQIGGKWYYFSTDSNNLGAMLTSTTTPDRKSVV